MSNFLETYGKSLFVLILMAILVAFSKPIGNSIKKSIESSFKNVDSKNADEMEI